MNKIIAIVGQAGSGKDTAASYISKKYKFKHISTSDILRDYINSNRLGNLTRQNMSTVIEKMRKQYGNDVLVRLALKEIGNKNVVISGLRHPDEARLVKFNNGKIIDISADLNSRYQRNSVRKREGDEISFDDFKKIENRENSGNGFNIAKVEKGSDFTIKNNGSYDYFYEQLDRIMEEIIAT